MDLLQIINLATQKHTKLELTYLRYLKYDYADQSCQSIQNNLKKYLVSLKNICRIYLIAKPH